MEYFEYDFDDNYLERLLQGDPATAKHFVNFFKAMMVRDRSLTSDKAEQLAREALLRIMELSTGGAQRPKTGWGAIAKSICNCVLHEYYRSLGSNQATG